MRITADEDTSTLQPVKKDLTGSIVKGCKIPNGLQSQVQELQNKLEQKVTKVVLPEWVLERMLRIRQLNF